MTREVRTKTFIGSGREADVLLLIPDHSPRPDGQTHEIQYQKDADAVYEFLIGHFSVRTIAELNKNFNRYLGHPTRVKQSQKKPRSLAEILEKL